MGLREEEHILAFIEQVHKERRRIGDSLKSVGFSNPEVQYICRVKPFWGE